MAPAVGSIMASVIATHMRNISTASAALQPVRADPKLGRHMTSRTARPNTPSPLGCVKKSSAPMPGPSAPASWRDARPATIRASVIQPRPASATRHATAIATGRPNAWPSRAAAGDSRVSVCASVVSPMGDRRVLFGHP